MKTPLILDFDGSVLTLMEGEIRLPLADWQETVRYGCTRRQFARLERRLAELLPVDYGCAFTGSGDYHHVSLLLIENLARRAKLAPASLDLLVCDNHPDNMRYPFGLHCGSWVRAACGLECVRRVRVVGITSADIAAPHAWENYLGPFLSKKLTYWSIGRPAGWLRLLGRGEYARNFADPAELLAALLPELHGAENIYLSLDKDVFGPEYVSTDWDQGVFTPEAMRLLIQGCAGKILGADITGETSAPHAYAGRFKKILSRLDGRRNGPEPEELPALQAVQRDLNLELFRLIEANRKLI